MDRLHISPSDDVGSKAGPMKDRAWLFSGKTQPLHQNVPLAGELRAREWGRTILDNRLTLVVAGPGFGKSTLLSQWYNTVQEAGARAAWLTISPEDTHTGHVCAYLRLSLSNSGLTGLDISREDFDALLSTPVKEHLHGFVRAMVQLDAPMVLFLDEAEHLGDEICTDLIQPLIRLMPDTFHLVVASRRRLPIGLASLHARGLAAEWTEADLRISDDEARELLAGYGDQSEIASQIGQLEGWPVALQLYRLALAKPGKAAIYQTGSGVPETLQSYLAETIIEAVPQDVSDFLLRASIFDELDIGTAAQVGYSQSVLVKAAETDVLQAMMVPLDPEHTTFRLHASLRDYLRQRLWRVDPQLYLTLQKNAALWCEERGDLVRACRHAIESREPDLTGRLLLKRGGMWITILEGIGLLLEMQKRFGERAFTSNRRLELLWIFLLVKQGRLSEAQVRFENLRQNTDRFRDHDTQDRDTELIQVEAVFTEAFLIGYGCRSMNQSFADLRHQVEARLATMAPPFQIALQSLFIVLSLQEGRTDRASEHIRTCRALCQSASSLYGEMYVDFHEGTLLMLRGRLDEAANRFDQGATLAGRHFSREDTLKLLAPVLKAELAALRGDWADAESHLSDLDLINQPVDAWLDVKAAYWWVRLELIYRRQGVDAALELAVQARIEARNHALDALESFIAAQMASRLARSGRADLAWRHMTDAGLFDEAGQPQFHRATSWRQREALIHAFGHVALRMGKRWPNMAQAMAEMADHAAAMENFRLEASAAFFAGLLYGHAGDHSLGEMWLNRAEARLETTRMTALIVGLPPESFSARPDLQRLASLSDPAIEAPVSATASPKTVDAPHTGNPSFLDPNKKSEATRSSTAMRLPQLDLSPREQTILEQVSKGHPDKIIARNLDISANTVRFHLKNVYRKLGVRNRIQAAKLFEKASEGGDA